MSPLNDTTYSYLCTLDGNIFDITTATPVPSLAQRLDSSPTNTCPWEIQSLITWK